MSDDELDRLRLRLCLEKARRSRDPNTKVGAILTKGADTVGIVAGGFNRFPRGIAETAERLADREVKNALMVHAEQAAILGAARLGAATERCSLYIAATDDTGAVWGGPPCASRCLPIVLEAGIREIVTYPFKAGPSKWAGEVGRSRELLAEAGIIYREVTP